MGNERKPWVRRVSNEASSDRGAILRFGAAYRVLQEAIAARAFPGCAFGVLVGFGAAKKVALHDALGRFTYEDKASAVTPNTVYDVASLTKVAATTAAAMLLNQRGRLDLDAPVGELLPGFVEGRAAEDAARRVTVKHLLAHNSGLPGYVELFRAAATPKALLEACMRLPVGSEPGERAEYSDPGFILLGKALETVMREEEVGSWVQREVFGPLEMMATGFRPEPAVRDAIPPTEEDVTFRHRRIQGEVQDENAWVLGGVAGHAGLFSNVEDLLRFGGAILDAARVGRNREKGTQLFEQTVVDRFAERQGPAGSSRALGWDTPSEISSTGKRFSARSIGHLGYTGCSLWIDLDAAVAIVLLTNRTWPDRSCQLIKQVRPAFHDAIREAL